MTRAARHLIVVAVAACAAQNATPATILFCPFDDMDGWQVRAVGDGRAELVGEPGVKRCVRVAARPGTVFLTRELPIGQVKGARVKVRCSAMTQDVVQGPQACSAAKVHMAILTPAGIVHYSARMAGSKEWSRQGFTADVPKDAIRVRLNLGLEACSGEARFDTLVVTNDRRGVQHLDLSATANARHDQLGLAAFPAGEVKWKDVTFRIMASQSRHAPDCLRLRGEGHDDWPAATSAPIPVHTAATALYILHAALGGKALRETPCVIWNATFADGHETSMSVFEGRDIGAVGQTKDSENWFVAWRGKGKDGKPVTFGVTKWLLYSEMPVLSLSCRSYRGAAPAVLAITAVEEPPAPASDDEEEEGY